MKKPKVIIEKGHLYLNRNIFLLLFEFFIITSINFSETIAEYGFLTYILTILGFSLPNFILWIIFLHTEKKYLQKEIKEDCHHS